MKKIELTNEVGRKLGKMASELARAASPEPIHVFFRHLILQNIFKEFHWIEKALHWPSRCKIDEYLWNTKSSFHLFKMKFGVIWLTLFYLFQCQNDSTVQNGTLTATGVTLLNG